jgi:hypothetical protein
MSKKCKAYSESKLGLIPHDNREAFYAGWDAAISQHQPRTPLTDDEIEKILRDSHESMPTYTAIAFAHEIERAHGIGSLDAAYDELREALASQTVPSDCLNSHQPDAWRTEARNEYGLPVFFCASEVKQAGPGLIPLYTAPPQQQAEPVGWANLEPGFDCSERFVFMNANAAKLYDKTCYKLTPVYTAPPKRKPLTDEEILATLGIDGYDTMAIETARAIERAHGIGGDL